MSTTEDKYSKEDYNIYKNNPSNQDFYHKYEKAKFLEEENTRLKDNLEKAYKKIRELESKLKLFDESLLTTSKSDIHKNMYVTSLELKNEKIQSLEGQIEELRKKHKKETSELQNNFEQEKKQEMNYLKEHNELMSELLDERNSGWMLRRDLAIRTNPVPDEPNEFGFPLDFDEKKVHNLHSNEEKPTWCKFKYYSEGEYPDGKFEQVDMPWSCYEFLSGRLPKNSIETKQKIVDNEEKIS